MAACGIIRPVLFPAEYGKLTRRNVQLVKILRQRYLTQLVIVMRFIKIPDKFRQGIIWRQPFMNRSCPLCERGRRSRNQSSNWRLTASGVSARGKAVR